MPKFNSNVVIFSVPWIAELFACIYKIWQIFFICFSFKFLPGFRSCFSVFCHISFSFRTILIISRRFFISVWLNILNNFNRSLWNLVEMSWTINMALSVCRRFSCAICILVFQRPIALQYLRSIVAYIFIYEYNTIQHNTKSF